MKNAKPCFSRAFLLALALIISPSLALVDAADIVLPAPDVSSGVISALVLREDATSFLDAGFPEQTIADMLWASLGVNRPLENAGTGMRTTNFSWKTQDTEVYVAAANGVFLYDPLTHSLSRVLDVDIRGAMNPSGVTPAYNLIYVSDLAKLGSNREAYGAIHAAFCAQNVTLYASEQGIGIATVYEDASHLHTLLGFGSNRVIHLFQRLGYKPHSDPLPGPWVMEARHLINAQVDRENSLKALKERRSTSSFSAVPLSTNNIANLMWAGSGKIGNSERFTYPSVSDTRHMDLYVALASGVYVYRELDHKLQQVSTSDIRATIDSSVGRRDACATLIYVSDSSKLIDVLNPLRVRSYHTGFMAQNVSAFCAEAGIGQHIRSSQPGNLAALLGLSGTQTAFIVQTIGFAASSPGNSQVAIAPAIGGQINPSSTQSIPYRGQGNQLTALPEQGYQFAYWTGLPGGRVTLNPLPLENVVCRMTIAAVFEEAEVLNHPPVLAPIGNHTVQVGSILALEVHGTDEDGQPLEYAASGE